MIVPDTKDWTWVLDQRCPDCGFDARSCPQGEVAGLVRANARRWQNLLADGRIRPGRPDDDTWSSLEYACHVRDVYRIYRSRIALMLRDDDPPFDNWDQDVTALAERYDEQAPELVVAELAEAAKAMATQLDQLTDSQWQRPGRRGDGASFQINTIARYMVHDPVHHIWDVSGRPATDDGGTTDSRHARSRRQRR
ncbi:MAG TPA: DinB family protein [Acidimicrobiales bacterium]|nr:DinB family protein [Acidimicrobiales bacterium]